MKYIELDGKKIESDIETIKSSLKDDCSVLFVYGGEGTLYDYIRLLNDGGRGLQNDDLYRFKVCYERKKLCLSYTSTMSEGTKRRRQIGSMTSLINELDGMTKCRIVVESDSRAELAFVVQQLIFLQYPLDTIDILLKKEVHDANKIKRFMERFTRLRTACDDALTRLTEMKERVAADDESADSLKDRLDDIDSALSSCGAIKKDLDKASEVELKLAVAASKKTGKSVIVNCFLGEEVAPTDSELATPNNCIYQRSADSRYHLKMENDDEVHHFESCQAIHDEIDKRFRAAQNDVDHGFQLPDMYISYCTEENNFSSYTIYDTAGPDAAGTNHREAAERAIHICDVAIFAIDYSKYLTDSEEKYLKEVKSIFEGQQKFHSLIFALNKIDVRYNDPKTVKSVISSVDFIRTRLENISAEYGACIIFPTCSLEYYNLLEAKASGITELDGEVTDMKALKFARRDVPALQWLHTHAENLEYYHGIQSFSAKVFAKDSGMPALMDYVSYIATSKARDEIINNVTFQIDTQSKKLRTVLNTVTNLEALIQADEQQIQSIKSILEDYLLAIREILRCDMTQEDMETLPSPNYLNDLYHGDFDDLKKKLGSIIEDECSTPIITKRLTESVKQHIWEKLSQYDKPMSENTCNRVIDNLCGKSDIVQILRAEILKNAGECQTKFTERFSKIRKEIKSIGIRRQTLLWKECEQTKERLAKNNAKLLLPEISDFEFDVPMPPINLNALNIQEIPSFRLGFDQLFQKEHGVGAFLKRLFTFGKSKKYELKVDKSQFSKLFDENLEKEITIAVLMQDTPKQICGILEKAFVDDYADMTIRRFIEVFHDTMNMQQEAINQFSKAIDDRDKFMTDIDNRTMRKNTIRDIQTATSDLMMLWEVVIGEVKEAAEDAVD